MSPSTVPPPAPAAFPSRRPIALAVLLPAYNEVQGIGATLTRVQDVLAALDCVSEVIVVDDGSTDGTAKAARESGVRVITHPTNLGYGAALKTGVRNTTASAVLIMDADCSYTPEAIPRLVALLENADMVVGTRELSSSGVAKIRRPAKWFLNRFATYLVHQPVPDLNSGQRVMKREVLLQYLHLLPEGFSFTSTITLAMIANGHPVIFEPIEYAPRAGESKIRPRHFLDFLVLMMRASVLFNPLRIFLPLSALFFTLGGGLLVRDYLRWRLSPTTVMALLAALMIWLLGLIVDMVSRLQMRPPPRT